MSDPNQPYGAVPPPAFPPPGAAPGGPPSGPPGGPPFPPPPPPGFGGPGTPGGSGTSGKGIWITLAIVGVLALVGLIVGLVLLLTGDDDDKDKDQGDDETSQASGADPEDVVEDLIDAAEEGDCDGATAFLTEAAKAADPCQSDEFQLLSSDDVDAEVGEATIDGDTATVPVAFSSPAGTSDYVFTLEQVDGVWLVASYDGDDSVPSAGPTDSASTDDASTDAPTDASTSPSGAAGGTSTADAVPNQPKAVVEAFLDSVVSGDCATAEELATAAYIEDEGDCDPSQIPSDFADHVTYKVGNATVNDAAGTATVPVEAEFDGSKESSTVRLVKVGGLWRVNSFD